MSIASQIFLNNICRLILKLLTSIFPFFFNIQTSFNKCCTDSRLGIGWRSRISYSMWFQVGWKLRYSVHKYNQHMLRCCFCLNINIWYILKQDNQVTSIFLSVIKVDYFSQSRPNIITLPLLYYHAFKKLKWFLISLF